MKHKDFIELLGMCPKIKDKIWLVKIQMRLKQNDRR